jgi:hypothetical protein
LKFILKMEKQQWLRLLKIRDIDQKYNIKRLSTCNIAKSGEVKYRKYARK